MRKLLFLATFLILLASPHGSAAFAETARSSTIIATGAYRQQIQATPIELRPNRPFHVYGNTVRRSYHRESAAPSGITFSRQQRVPRPRFLR